MRLLRLLILLLPLPCMAAEWQSLPAIQSAVQTFVQEKTSALPGEHSVTVSRIDPRLKLAKCAQLEPAMSAGNRLWGNSSVQVRCLEPTPWSIYVPILIKVSNHVLVSIRPIAAGQPVQAEDVQLQLRDITAFAGSALTSTNQVTGRMALAPIASGTILRAEMLRAEKVIQFGQAVKLVAQGAGFKITSEGVAMGNATAGQVVSVKTRSGQIIKGIARGEGVVEVYF